MYWLGRAVVQIRTLSRAALALLPNRRINGRETLGRYVRCSLEAALDRRSWRMAEVGRKYALTTVRSRSARFHWPLSGDEIEERTDAARPVAVTR